MGVIVREKPKNSNVWWIFISLGRQRKSIKIGLNKKDLATEIQDEIIKAITLNRLTFKERSVDVNRLVAGSARECRHCWVNRKINKYLCNIIKSLKSFREEGYRASHYYVDVKTLSDGYVKQLLKKQGFKEQDITKEEIKIKRVNVLLKRELRKRRKESDELFRNQP